MKAKPSPRLIAHISSEIAAGNALWAMLMANEYELGTELLRALQEKAGRSQSSAESAIYNGRTLSSLSVSERATIPGSSLNLNAQRRKHRQATLLAAQNRRPHRHRQDSLTARGTIQRAIQLNS